VTSPKNTKIDLLNYITEFICEKKEDLLDVLDQLAPVHGASKGECLFV